MCLLRVLRELLIAGSRATEGYEFRQVRKEAAAVTDPVCRGAAQLSAVPARRRCRFSIRPVFVTTGCLTHQWGGAILVLPCSSEKMAAADIQ